MVNRSRGPFRRSSGPLWPSSRHVARPCVAVDPPGPNNKTTLPTVDLISVSKTFKILTYVSIY